MNKKILMTIVVFAALLTGSASYAEDNNHRMGFGANYWKTIKDIDLKDVDKNGFSWLATYQYSPGSPLSLEADIEYFNRGFAGTSKDVFAPQAYIILGTHIYGAIGIGTYYTDGEFADDPFYALRLGIDFKVFQNIYMDINANYRFNEWRNIGDMAKDIDSDTITLGTSIRMEF